MDISYVQFSFRELQGDPLWFSGDPLVCGCYWKIITWIYCEGGRIRYDLPEIEKFLLWDSQKYGPFSVFFSSALRKKFQIRGRFLYHKRCTLELKKSQDAHCKRVMAGRKKSIAPAMLQQCSSNAEALLGKGKERKGKEKKGNNAMPPDMFAEFAKTYKFLRERFDLKTESDKIHLQEILQKLFKTAPAPYEAYRVSLVETYQDQSWELFKKTTTEGSPYAAAHP